MTPQSTPADDESGISMVEVIIYSALTALLLSVLGGLFFVGFKTQAATGGRDAATGAAQVVSNSLQTSIRNASSVSVSGTILKARVASGDTGWQCVTWALTADEKLVYKTSSSAITSTDYSTWTVLATGASGLGGGAPFIETSTASSAQISYSLAFTSGSDLASVLVAGTVIANAYGTGSPASCW